MLAHYVYYLSCAWQKYQQNKEINVTPIIPKLIHGGYQRGKIINEDKVAKMLIYTRRLYLLEW